MKNLIKNSAFNLSSYFVNFIIGIITVPIFINKLTPELYGIFIVLLSLLGYYGLMDIGLGQAVIKFIAEYESKKDYDSISRFIFTSTVFYLIFASLGTFTLYALSQNLLIILKIPDKFIPDSNLAVKIFAFGFFFSMLSTNFSSIFQGFQQYNITSKINIIINILLYTTSIIGLYYGGKLIFLSITFSLFYFLSFLTYIYLLIKQHRIIVKKIKYDYRSLKELFSFSTFFFLSKILNTFGNYLIQFNISIILNPLAVTYYVVPRKLVNSIAAFIGSGSAVLFPKVSELSGNNRKEEIIKLYYQSSKIISFLAFPIFFIFFIFSKEILIIWVGNDLANKTYIIMYLISFQILIGVLTIVPNNFLLGLGQTKIQGKYSFITTIIILISMPLFTYYFNVEGTVIALIISSVPGIILVNYLNKEILKINNRIYWQKIITFHFIFYALAFILMIMEYYNFIHSQILLIYKFWVLFFYCILLFRKNKSIILRSVKSIKYKTLEV